MTFLSQVRRLEASKIPGHRRVRGRGGKVAVTHETHRQGLRRGSWKPQPDLHLRRRAILSYRMRPQHLLRIKKSIHMLCCAAARIPHRVKGLCFTDSGHRLVRNAAQKKTFTDTRLPKGAYLYFKGVIVTTSAGLIGFILSILPMTVPMPYVSATTVSRHNASDGLSLTLPLARTVPRWF